ncbi:MAG: type 1 fimbrial protein [Pseudomonadota bacterium]|jgi:type 1 fimbria pilin|uniref:Fimbrial protein n=1 Tax=Caballeronia sordidicola TaxID=196367 RepID=A0A242M5I7_CABSO|nr:fimbrial protein [Caballeronia sordidicola]MDP9156087.1 type 1 fimbrial protein [Pseudomonadota bacterium]OTP66459.1 Fimbrial protein precursor [Caballeronia sordidicola]
MRINRLSRLILRALALSLPLFTFNAFARYTDCTAPLPLTVNLPSVSVPSSLPVGQSIPGAKASFAIPVTCSYTFPGGSRWHISSVSATIALVPGFSDVYTFSGMGAGVGFRMRGADGSILALVIHGTSLNAFDVGPASNGSNLLQGSFELVRTAKLMTPGSFSFSMVASVNDQEFANKTDTNSNIKYGYTMNPVTVAACTVTQTDIAVTLPTVPTSALSSVGATAGTQLFAINLQCEEDAKPQISIADVVTPSNQSTELSLAPDSTATGVAVQILSGSSLVRYSPSSLFYTTSNVPLTNTISFGTFSGTAHIPFNARYVRVAGTLKAGTVRALATFTFSYQ